jgi:hypothetical protein
MSGEKATIKQQPIKISGYAEHTYKVPIDAYFLTAHTASKYKKTQGCAFFNSISSQQPWETETLTTHNSEHVTPDLQIK